MELQAEIVYAQSLAILVPCRNEAVAIAEVVAGFRAHLPQARIYVYDNNSHDGTAAAAAGLGVVVRHEPRQGKGHVVRRMFADVEADIYVLVDGDGTYDAQSAPAMVKMLLDHRLDMVTGTRVAATVATYRRGHRTGNLLLTGIVAWIFGDRISDMMSGYRVFSRRFVKSFPARSAGFETETELTIHALELDMPLGELATPYRERGEGSASKLNTWRDGFRILVTILDLMKDQKPLLFFSLAGAALFAIGLGLSVPALLAYERAGLVPRLDTALFCTATVLLSFLSVVCGLVLDSVAHGRKETMRMAYLAVPGPGACD